MSDSTVTSEPVRTRALVEAARSLNRVPASKTREYGIIHDDPSDRIPAPPHAGSNAIASRRAIGLVSGLPLRPRQRANAK